MGVVCTGERFGGMDLSNATAPMQTPQSPSVQKWPISRGTAAVGMVQENWSGEPQGPSQLLEALGLFVFLKSYSKWKDHSITTSGQISHLENRTSMLNYSQMKALGYCVYTCASHHYVMSCAFAHN